MKDFGTYNLYLYTEVEFGKDSHEQVGKLIKKHGGSKVLFVYDSVAKMIGIYDEIVNLLRAAEIEFVEFTGIKANPSRKHTALGIQLAKQEKVDFVLAVGGGSTIDTSKAISFGALYEGDWWDLYTKKAVSNKRLPVGAIPTIAASGSEMSQASVIVDDVDTGKKVSLHSDYARPVFVIMNPEFTYTVPKFQTAAGAADIFAHTFERYFYHDSCMLADGFAEGLLKTVVKYGPIAVNHPDNYEARAELLLCASFSHNNITNVGHSKGPRGGAHGVEAILSAAFDTAHGAGLAVVMPEWMRFAADYSEEGLRRVAKMAIQVFGVSPDLEDLKSVAYEGAKRCREWLNSMGLPATLTQLNPNITEKDIPMMVEKGRFGADGLYRSYVTMTREDLAAFYKRIL